MDTHLEQFRSKMPNMFDHAGVWEGTYTHLDAAAQIIDEHASQVICEFPTEGPFAYIQHNRLTWPDGRVNQVSFHGTYKNERLWWNTPLFSGSAWETRNGIILLDLDRKDEVGATFREIILMGDTGKHRTRTWHWFRDGQLFRRTICEERRV